MSYVVYILYSEKCDKYYVGHTDDIQRRLDEHNSGRGGKFTKNCRPLILKYTEILPDKKAAVIRELEIKKRKDRNYLERLILTIES
jgi:putative endonuclease